MTKKAFRIPGDAIKPLVRGFGGCIASDRIMVDGAKVGVMTREEPTDPQDSGWAFTAGDETQEYLDDARRSGIYEVNTVANYDPDIIPLLYSEVGASFVRGADGRFEPDGEQPPTPVRPLTKQWSLALNSCFQSRVEEGSLVLIAPARTLFVNVWKAKPGETPKDRMLWIKKAANAQPLKRWEPSATRHAYLLHEVEGGSGRWALYTATVDPHGGHLWIAFYFDFEADVEWALRTWDSVAFAER